MTILRTCPHYEKDTYNVSEYVGCQLDTIPVDVFKLNAWNMTTRSRYEIIQYVII